MCRKKAQHLAGVGVSYILSCTETGNDNYFPPVSLGFPSNSNFPVSKKRTSVENSVYREKCSKCDRCSWWFFLRWVRKWYNYHLSISPGFSKKFNFPKRRKAKSLKEGPQRKTQFSGEKAQLPKNGQDKIAALEKEHSISLFGFHNCL